MKKINLLLLLTIAFVLNGYAQTPYNPFTQNIHFAPEPTVAGFPCGSVQTVGFTQGLTTAADATQWQTAPLTVTICITGFTFNGPVSSVVSGSYASNFNWAYDSFAPNCIIGTQNQTIFGTGTNPIFPNPASSGDILLSLVVPEISPINTVLAVNVNLQVPGYMQAFNSTPDDNESTQTQTFCSLVIRGAVFNDTDSSANVSGSPIYSPSGEQLFANLLGSGDIVVATTPISSNGTYIFNNVTPGTNYKVLLSTLQGLSGNPAPVADLPSVWINTGEDCCDNIGNDGNPNGIMSVPVTNYSKINVNFGIKNPLSTGAPLPLILKDFFASEYNCGGLLSWTTSQEENTSHVEIFRRDGAGSFHKIATVQSAGNSNREKIYSYLDKGLEQNISYEYQLRFVDIDEKFSLSDVKTLKLNCDKNNSTLNVFPNPASNEVNVLFVTEGDDEVLNIDIYDVVGKKILSKSQSIINGSNIISFDISSFAKGTYLLQYHDENQTTVGSVKFIKN